MSIDGDHRVLRFDEKPETPANIPGDDSIALVSMGIYVFNTEHLLDILDRDSDCDNSVHDFGRDIIPSLIDRCRVFAFPFRNAKKGHRSYWRDVGTVDAFWRANQELIGVTPDLNLYDREWPIYTHQEQSPPAKFVFDDDDRRGLAVDSMVAGGCIVSGAKVAHTLLFSNVRVESFSEICDSVVLPEVTIGKNCRIKRAVIDKGCDIPDDTDIGFDLDGDAKRFYVSREGITLVTPEMLDQDTNRVRRRTSDEACC